MHPAHGLGNKWSVAGEGGQRREEHDRQRPPSPPNVGAGRGCGASRQSKVSSCRRGTQRTSKTGLLALTVAASRTRGSG